MMLRTMALLVGWSLLQPSGYSLAQDLENFPDAALTSEQWQRRVQDARRRSEEFVANARTQTADPAPSDKQDAEAADQRAMNDPSLQRGDIIATSQGFLVSSGATAKSVSLVTSCQPHRRASRRDLSHRSMLQGPIQRGHKISVTAIARISLGAA